MLASVLIANRGEIAVRVARACRDLGIRSIAVYSDADRDAEHVRLADEAVHIGPADLHESYLSVQRVVAAAVETGARAVHPGYGLLSENPTFAEQVLAAGLTFVGPRPEVIELLGDKRTARERATAAGLQVLPARDLDDDADADEAGAAIGYPLLVKAAFGGGGRGMRVVNAPAELASALEQARRETRSAFGRSEIYLERFLPKARHIEVQILADAHGNVRHLGTRDCTIQRRNQKLVEEAPAFGLPADLLEQVLRGSVRLATAIGYQSAGTVEFLVDPATDSVFFLEVNTRLQVEHTVTELVTGVDIVAAQLQIASGEPITFAQEDVVIDGHAIEARINAEDAASGFLPHAGTVERLCLPGGPWIRVDSGVSSGTAISTHYDSLLAKITAWAPDREGARARLARALGETLIEGIPSTTGFLGQVLADEHFRAGTHWTGLVDSGGIDARAPQLPQAEPLPQPSGPHTRWRGARIHTPGAEIQLDIPIHRSEARSAARSTAERAAGGTGSQADNGGAGSVAPMDGILVRHTVQVGEIVDEQTTVAVVESMKMETHVRSGRRGVVIAVHASAGDSLRRGDLLVTIEAVVA